MFYTEQQEPYMDDPLRSLMPWHKSQLEFFGYNTPAFLDQ